MHCYRFSISNRLSCITRVSTFCSRCYTRFKIPSRFRYCTSSCYFQIICYLTCCRIFIRCNSYRFICGCYNCTHTFQLVQVNCVSAICARSQVYNLVVCCAIAHGQVAASNLYCWCISCPTRCAVKRNGGSAIRDRVNIFQRFS